MKYILLFATLFILAGTACKKSKTDPVDILPGNWERKSAEARTEPAYVSYGFKLDKTFTYTRGGVMQTGTYKVYVPPAEPGKIEVTYITDQGTSGALNLEMVSRDEFRINQVYAGPGPGPGEQVLLRVR